MTQPDLHITSSNCKELSVLLDRMEDPEYWCGMEPDELSRLVRIAFPAYEFPIDPRLEEALPILYTEYRKAVAEEIRRDFIGEMISREIRGEAKIDSLMAIAHFEEEPELVAMAAIAYATLYSGTGDDLLVGTEDLIMAIRASTPECRAGVFGGLLSLGDDRICGLLWPVRWELTLPELSSALDIRSDAPHVATILFLLEWLKEVDADTDRKGFALIASALARAASHAGLSLVVDGRRRLPALQDGPIYEYGHREMLVSELADRIAPTLRDIAGREKPLCLMPRVLEAWGLPLNEGIN